MRVLVIGGSVFVGRAVVSAALDRGDEVTVFNRGASGAPPPGATHVRGDRTVAADLEQLRGRRFDLVVDTCGYVPADVAAGAELLAPTCHAYVFVSTISVFPGWPEAEDYRAGGVWDGPPDATRDDAPSPEAAYGWLKSGCERAVRRAFGDERSTVLRAGLIVGPHDRGTGRLPWWIDRVSRGGEVLVPTPADGPIPLLDVRDLADFALTAAPGAFEVTGPPDRDTRADLLAACAAATGTTPHLTWVDGEWLLAQGVDSWVEVPLWLPASEGVSVFRHDPSAAVAAGLHNRPLAETVADTWAWQQQVPGGWRPAAATPGLDPHREQELLAAWHAR